MTPAGVDRLKLDEAVGGKPPLTAYQDTGGVWTVGWGCTGAGIGPGTTWSLAQAEAALVQRIAQTESGLRNRFTWFEVLERTDPVRADVLVNIAFNIGITGLGRWPVTLAAVKARDWPAAAADILGNTVWRDQVHDRCLRCSGAMRTGNWGGVDASVEVTHPADVAWSQALTKQALES
jgi:GH24 family phage-related lysozyme (muramidase)